MVRQPFLGGKKRKKFIRIEKFTKKCENKSVKKAAKKAK